MFIDSDQIKSFVFTLGCDMASHKSIQDTKRIMEMVLAEVGSDLDNSELDYAAQVVTCLPADKVNTQLQRVAECSAGVLDPWADRCAKQ